MNSPKHFYTWSAHLVIELVVVVIGFVLIVVMGFVLIRIKIILLVISLEDMVKWWCEEYCNIVGPYVR